MAEKKLESFKIGASQKAGIAKAKGKSPEKSDKTKSEEPSLGFRRIETILETDEAAKVSESLNKLLSSLEEKAQKSGNNREKASAQKAMVAVERTVDLMDYLFQTKAQMIRGG